MSETPNASLPAKTRRRYPWRLFFLLLGLATGSAALTLPYLLDVAHAQISRLAIPLPRLIALQLLQSALLSSLALTVGLTLGPHYKLGVPEIYRLVYREGLRDLPRRRIAPAFCILAGLLCGLLIFALDFFLFLPALKRAPALETVASWKALMASFGSAFYEEVLMRLGWMTLLVAIFGKLLRRNLLPAAVYWLAILLTALLFGLGRLPVPSLILELSQLFIVRALLLNGLGGILYGYLYWRYSFLSAVLAHFSTGVALYVLIPAVLQQLAP